MGPGCSATGPVFDPIFHSVEIQGAGGAAWDPGGAEEPAAGSSGLRRRKDL